MRNSNLLKWAQNMNNKSGKDAENRNWIHPPEALSRGHIAYLVKFLGNLEVDQPKGIEVVKEGIRKLKYNQQHIRKSEGSKLPKVELTISVDGVAIQEPKTKRIMHQYPLHRISYCADDKAERRFFSFIVKETPESEQHMCFVFLSDKLSEDITLTIGQAFDLAYKRFLEMELQRRLMGLQQRVNTLESENNVLKKRLTDIASGQDVESYMKVHGLSDITHVDTSTSSNNTSSNSAGQNNSSTTNGDTSLLLNLNDVPTPTSNGSTPAPPVPPRSFQNDLLSDLALPSSLGGPTVGRKLEGLLLDEMMDDDFDPRAYESSSKQSLQAPPPPLVNEKSVVTPVTPPLLAPPPNNTRRTPNHQEDMFGLTPFNDKGADSQARDPFGMGDFAMGSVTGGLSGPGSKQDLESAIGLLDRRIMEMKDGFSRGLSIGTEDFSIESLDPLRK